MHRRGPRPWLGLTGADNEAKGPLGDYSHVVPGGRRKRVCIACPLFHSPPHPFRGRHARVAQGPPPPKWLQQWISPVRDIPWVIRSPGIWDGRGAACDPEATLRTVRYLARYVNRIAISNRRLLGIEGDKILLRYNDYRDGNRWKVEAIDRVEFIRRFLRHLLPPRLRHI